jgi:hypothetical protein
MNEYPVALFPERVFEGCSGWIYVAEAPPDERDEIEVYAFDREGKPIDDSETRVIVTTVDNRATPALVTARGLD